MLPMPAESVKNGSSVELDLTEPTKNSFKFKADLPENNPCFHEAKLTYKCLEENNYRSQLCVPFQENYKMCRQFWSRVTKDRSHRGILPHLPPLAEREAIKKEYNLSGDRIVDK